MMGGPPPPMMGGLMAGMRSAAQRPAKPKITPKKEMKPLFWDKLNLAQQQGTVWQNIAEVPFDENEFVFMFSKKEVKKVETTTSKKKDPEDEPLISEKLFNNLSIMLHKIPKVAKLQPALLNLDATVITKEIVEVMLQNVCFYLVLMNSRCHQQKKSKNLGQIIKRNHPRIIMKQKSICL